MRTTIVMVGVTVILIAGAIILFRGGGNGQANNGDILGAKSSANQTSPSDASNVSVVDGKQIVEISVKGGYRPKKSTAKAGIPTVLRFVTNGTYDCSSAVTIPSMKVSKNLPATGSTDIEVGTPTAGTLDGTCTMGMYSFQVVFE